MFPAGLRYFLEMRAPLLLSSLLTLAACKASFNTNFSTKSASADAEVKADTDATPGETQTAIIVRNGNKLDYKGGEIEFETDSAKMRGRSSESILDSLAAVLLKLPEIELRIEGHTDSRGSKDYNRKLSDDRAAAIKTALINRGIEGKRLSSEGMGEDKPKLPEPDACHNKAEERVAAGKRDECNRIWAENRRAAFVVTAGIEALPPEGETVHQPAEPATTGEAIARKPAADERRPDWALRFFGGYTLIHPGVPFHGGHFGVGVHASQRFGKRRRGYIGGGPRLHYRGVRNSTTNLTAGASGGSTFHEFGPEGDLLIGGGSDKFVALLSLRLGLGLGAARDGVTSHNFLTGWGMGGVMLLGKITPRWSLGGHAEAGLTNVVIASIDPIFEVGLNVAWHFGKGRRKGI